MADSTFSTQVSKDEALNAAGNPIFVTLVDATGDQIAIDGSGFLTVNVNGTVPVSATDLDIRDLVYTGDSIAIWSNTAKDGTGTDYQPLVDTDGHLQVDVLSGGGSNDSVVVDDTAFTAATDSITLIGAANTADTVDAGDRGALRMLTNRALVVTMEDSSGNGITVTGGNVLVESQQDTHDDLNCNANLQVGDTDVSNGNPVPISDAGGSITVDGTVAISGDVNVTNSGTFAVQVDNVAYAEDSAHTTSDDGLFCLGVRNTAISDVTSTDGDYSQISTTIKGAVLTEILQGNAALSSSNPLPVTITDPVASGTEVHDYDDTSTAAAGTTNHDYAVSGTTFYLHKVTCGSSGAFSCEVQSGPVASLASLRKGFFGDRNGGYLEFDFSSCPVEVAATGTGTVRVIRGNRNPGTALSIYSSIEGFDI